MAVNVAAVAPSEKRIAAALQHRFFLRLHMTAILTATLLVGVVVTRVLARVHLNIFAVRYGLAVVASYAAFVGFIKVWFWYVEFCESRDRRKTQTSGSSSGGNWFDGCNFGSGGASSSSSGSGVLSSGGGKFGGGGASGSWDDDAKPSVIPLIGKSSGGSHSGGGGGGSSDLGELMLVVLIVAVLVAIVASFVWIVWAAPSILSEAFFNAFLTGALVHHAHTATHGQWVGSVLKKTAIPFLLILGLAVALGWYAQHYCPGALRLRDAVNCVNPAS